MKIYKLTALLVILLGSISAESLSDTNTLQINKNFIELWEQAESLTFPFQYKEISLELRFERCSPYFCELKVYDLNDPFLGPQNLPFAELFIRIGTEKNTVYFSNFRKTTNVSDKARLDLTLKLLKQMHIFSCKVSPDEQVASCPKNGIWCSNQLERSTSISRAILFQKCYYEELGATPDSQYLHLFTSFFHTLPLSYLKSDLHSLGRKYDEAKRLYNLLQDIQNRLSFDETYSFGKLAQELYERGKKNQIDHLLWHDFSDSFIEDKNSFLNDLILEFLEGEHVKKSSLILDVIKCLGRDNVYLLYEIFTREVLEDSVISKHEFLIEYYKNKDACLDQLADKYWKEAQEEENIDFFNFNREMVKKYLLMWMHQPATDLESMKRLCELLFDSEKQLYLEPNVLAELLQNWKEDASDLPEGYLWILFHTVKMKLNSASSFTFYLADDLDQQGAI